MLMKGKHNWWHFWEWKNFKETSGMASLLLIFVVYRFEIKLRATVGRPSGCLLITGTIRGCIQKFRTGRLERVLQMVQLSATKCSYIAILWVSLVSFAAISLCVASQRVIPKVSVYFVRTESGNFRIHTPTNLTQLNKKKKKVFPD
jgi:hypothetical protein